MREFTMSSSQHHFQFEVQDKVDVPNWVKFQVHFWVQIRVKFRSGSWSTSHFKVTERNGSASLKNWLNHMKRFMRAFLMFSSVVSDFFGDCLEHSMNRSSALIRMNWNVITFNTLCSPLNQAKKLGHI